MNKLITLEDFDETVQKVLFNKKPRKKSCPVRSLSTRECFQCKKSKESTEYKNYQSCICKTCGSSKNKRCFVCREVKSKSEFVKSRGLVLSRCKKCSAMKVRKWQKDNLEKWKQILHRSYLKCKLK